MKKLINLCLVFVIVLSAGMAEAKGRSAQVMATWEGMTSQASHAYTRNDDYFSAVALQGEAADYARDNIGKNTFEYGVSLFDLGRYSLAAGVPEEADKLIEQGVDIICKSSEKGLDGAIYSDTASRYFGIRGFKDKQIKYAEQSLKYYHKVAKPFKGARGERILREQFAGTSSGKLYFAVIDDLVQGLMNQGGKSIGKAITVLNDVMKNGKGFLTDKEYYFFKEWLANIYSGQGDYKKAEKVLIEVMLETKGLGDQATLDRAYNKLIDFYIARGMTEAEGKKKADDLFYSR